MSDGQPLKHGAEARREGWGEGVVTDDTLRSGHIPRQVATSVGDNESGPMRRAATTAYGTPFVGGIFACWRGPITFGVSRCPLCTRSLDPASGLLPGGPAAWRSTKSARAAPARWIRDRHCWSCLPPRPSMRPSRGCASAFTGARVR